MRFYDEVFGWKELPTETVDRKKLVLSAYTYEQFVFLIADEPPMACPRLDHFGMSVDTEQELDDMLAGPRRSRRGTTASTSSTGASRTTACS